MPPQARRARRASVVLLLPALLGAVAIPASAGPHRRLDEINERREALERRIEQVDAAGDAVDRRVAVLDDRRADAEAEVESLDARLAALDADIVEVQERLTEAQHHLTFLSEQLAELRARLAARMDVFKDRAVAAYVAGPAAELDGLLSAENFGDLIERYTYYESALDSDSTLIVQIQRLEETTDSRRAEVEEKKNEIAAQKLRLEEDRARVAALRDERAQVLAVREEAIAQKKTVLTGLRTRQDRLERIEEQLAQESAEIEALLAQAASSTSTTSDGSTSTSTSPAPAPDAGGQLLWPANGPLTSGYGMRVHPIFGTARMHTGIDIGAAYGSPVWAADDGRVAYVGAMSGYGNVVVVDHGGGLATTYNHLSGYQVSSGQSVSRGQQIATVGCTGYCTGPHLHFEVRINGSPVDPMPYLR